MHANRPYHPAQRRDIAWIAVGERTANAGLIVEGRAANFFSYDADERDSSTCFARLHVEEIIRSIFFANCAITSHANKLVL